MELWGKRRSLLMAINLSLLWRRQKTNGFVGFLWVFKKKEWLLKYYGPIYKAQVVANNCSKVEGFILYEILSSVVMLSSIRGLLVFWCDGGLVLSMGFGGLYIHKAIKRFEIVSKEDLVCSLKKVLYGFKQSSRLWYKS